MNEQIVLEALKLINKLESMPIKDPETRGRIEILYDLISTQTIPPIYASPRDNHISNDWEKAVKSVKDTL